MEIFKNIYEAAEKLDCKISGEQILFKDIPIAKILVTSTLVNCKNITGVHITETTPVHEVERIIIHSQTSLYLQLNRRFEQACILLNYKFTASSGRIAKCWGYYTTPDDVVIMLTWDNMNIVATNIHGSVCYTLSPFMTVEDIVNKLFTEHSRNCEERDEQYLVDTESEIRRTIDEW